MATPRYEQVSAASIDHPGGGDIETGGGGTDAAPGGEAIPGQTQTSPLGQVKGTTPMEAVMGTIAAIAVVASIATIILNVQNHVIMLGAIFSGAMAPYAWWQQTKLTDIKALKETQQHLQSEVDNLSNANTRLKKNMTELTETVDRLECIEEALEVITQVQGQSVAAFAEQIEENRAILGQMQKNLRANVLQNLLNVIIRSDEDGNLHISQDEIDDLVERMNSINGVRVNEARFRQAIAEHGGSLQAVMAVVKDLMSDEGGDQGIFEIEEYEEEDYGDDDEEY